LPVDLHQTDSLQEAAAPAGKAEPCYDQFCARKRQRFRSASLTFCSIRHFLVALDVAVHVKAASPRATNQFLPVPHFRTSETKAGCRVEEIQMIVGQSDARDILGSQDRRLPVVLIHDHVAQMQTPSRHRNAEIHRPPFMLLNGGENPVASPRVMISPTGGRSLQSPTPPFQGLWDSRAIRFNRAG